MITCKALLCLALTLWGESRGESHEGRMAVASVVWNRAVSKGKYDLTWVVLRPRQFAYWNGRDTRNLKEPEYKYSLKDEEVWLDCVAIAQSMIDGTFKPTVSANHYYAPSKVEPYWGKELKDVVVIGNHKFGRL